MTCKDCIHYEACVFWTAICSVSRMFSKGKCGFFKDKSKIVEVPCKVGDTVFVIGKRVEQFIVFDISTYDSGRAIDLCCENESFEKAFWFTLGKTAFLTRAEAEAALEKLKGETDGTVH